MNEPEKDQGDEATSSLAEAKLQADAMLGDGHRFIVSTPREFGPRFGQLSPATIEFFSRYPHVQSRSGGIVLGRDLIGASTYVQGFVSIGYSEGWDIVQKPGDDKVFIVEGSEKTLAEMEDQYQSIYHFIVYEGSVTSGFDE